MDIQTLEKDNADLQKQNRKRTFVIVGFMIAGAVGGFVLARGMKGKTLAKVGATIGGSFLLGLPVLFATRKKTKERRVKIEENKKQIEALKAGTPISNTVNAVVAEGPSFFLSLSCSSFCLASSVASMFLILALKK